MDTLLLAAGSMLSLGFNYIPGLSQKYDSLGDVQKRLVMGIMIVLVSVGYYIAGCYEITDLVTCSKDGAITIVGYVIQALMANQTTHLLTKPVDRKDKK